MSFSPYKKRKIEKTVRMGDWIHGLANSMKKRFEELPPLSSKCCIYKVPRTLREANLSAYEPSLISIGPLHYGMERLEGMQEHKLRYVQGFLRRNEEKTIKDYLRAVRGWEKEAREYYIDPIDLSSNEFVEMVFLDACFVIEFFMNCHWDIVDENDRIFGKPSLEYVIIRDLLLIENQIPFFVLEGLYDLVFDNESCPRFLPFVDLTYEVLVGRGELPMKLKQCEILHFVDFYRTYHLPSELRDPKCFKSGDASWNFCPGIGDLHDAGVKFVISDSDSLLDIRFEDGVLQIPRLSVEDDTECLFLNLSAFEQCHYHFDSYIVDYILFMDVLITTLKDVDLLISSGIVKNALGNNEDVARIFNTICRETTYDASKFYYADICRRLIEHSEKPCNRWKATLKHDYFSNPWTMISVFAAVLLLIITVVQTYCSIASLKS